jgi:hypothetical protein
MAKVEGIARPKAAKAEAGVGVEVGVEVGLEVGVEVGEHWGTRSLGCK